MRRIFPLDCPPKVGAVLKRRQAKLDSDTSKVKSSWKQFSRLKTYQTLREVLAEPLGVRRRCAYCCDSRAADVEHFWPKVKHPSRAYSYENMLLICPECNRTKNDGFALDAAGLPLLVNPAVDDPWDMLYYSPLTGILAARITGLDSFHQPIFDERGFTTLETLGSILNSTPVIEGRKTSWARLEAQVQAVLEGRVSMPSTQQELFGSTDEYGLGDFMLNREGKEFPTLRRLRADWPSQWNALRGLPR